MIAHSGMKNDKGEFHNLVDKSEYAELVESMRRNLKLLRNESKDRIY